MGVKKYLERIRYIDYLISHKSTGNCDQLSRKLGLSRSSTLEYLRLMKDLGFPISYSRNRNSYYYSEEGKMIKSFFVKEEI